MTPELQQSVKEFHPELAWKRLAGSLLASKHRPEGLLQRINVLNKHKPTWLAALENLRLPSEVKLDDILDSIVGISVAHAISQGPSYKNKFPEGDPPKDERGLGMEIWF
jgi:predicted RNase H-like nuclease